MDIDKIALLIYKKCPHGICVLAWKPQGIDSYFLPNIASKGEDLKNEANQFLKYMGFADNQIILDLSLLNQDGVACKCFVVPVSSDTIPFQLPFLDDNSFIPVDELQSKLVLPYKNVLKKFANWEVL